jgi:hypothetical protein
MASQEEIDFSKDRHALLQALARLLNEEAEKSGVDVVGGGAHLDSRTGSILPYTLSGQELATYIVFRWPHSEKEQRLEAVIADFENWKPIVHIFGTHIDLQEIQIRAKSALVFQELRSAVKAALSKPK